MMRGPMSHFNNSSDAYDIKYAVDLSARSEINRINDKVSALEKQSTEKGFSLNQISSENVGSGFIQSMNECLQLKERNQLKERHVSKLGIAYARLIQHLSSK